MNKAICVRGFLYHPATNQVLLRQKSASAKTPQELSPLCYLIEEPCLKNDIPIFLFQKSLKSLLGINIKNAIPVYTYYDEDEKKNVFVYYTIIKQKKNFPDKGNSSFVWSSLKQVTKLKLTKRIEHDLIIGQRVIDSAGRKKRGEQYLE